MRWSVPNDGEIRIAEKFLVFPLELNGEGRWLEKAYIVEEYRDHGASSYWQRRRFATKEEYRKYVHTGEVSL